MKITETKAGLNYLLELANNPAKPVKSENIKALIYFAIFVFLFIYLVFFANKTDRWSVYAIFFFCGIWLSQAYTNFVSARGIQFLSKYIDIKKVKNELKENSESTDQTEQN